MQQKVLEYSSRSSIQKTNANELYQFELYILDELYQNKQTHINMRKEQYFKHQCHTTYLFEMSLALKKGLKFENEKTIEKRFDPTVKLRNFEPDVEVQKNFKLN